MTSNTLLTPLRQKKLMNLAIGLLKFVFIVGICYLFLFPVLNMVITSFKSLATSDDPTIVWIPKGVSLEGIKTSMEKLNYGQTAPLTLKITILSTLFALISCSLAGYGLARFNFPGKSIVMVAVILTIIIPPQVLYSSTYILYSFFDFGGLLSMFGVDLNLIDTHWVFTLPSIFASGLRNGIFVFIFYSFFKGLPVEMEEAAKIDGCGIFTTYMRVMLPLAVPSFITVLLFSLVWHWTDFQSASTYFTDEVRPLTVMLSNLKANITRGDATISSASENAMRIYIQSGALLCVAPPLVLYMFTQKYFTESIERTGLVG